MHWNSLFKLLIVPICFLFVGIYTLSHYGINWDESFHFQRGQAYLHYFLTGKKDFLDLPAYTTLNGSSDFMGRTGEQDIYLAAEKSKQIKGLDTRRSYYQSDVFTYSFLVSGFDGGHPPTSDIFAAFSNFVFFQKLGWLGDIEAYHLYEIFAASLLVLGIGIFVTYNYRVLAALVSQLTLVLYPLFFAESHFNIKDPPETAFFGLAVITFYFGIINRSWKLIILSSMFSGFALGTKFNALFLPFIVIPWFVFYILVVKSKFRHFLSKKILSAFLIFPIIAIGLLFLFWPFLWANPAGNFLKVVNYYQNIGIGVTSGMEEYIVGGINTYPILWIIYTTPIPILVLFLVGFVYSLFLTIKQKKSAPLLILLWFLIPIARVTFFEANIYGGARQIMEYVPAMAILSGIGVIFLLGCLPKFKVAVMLVIFFSLFFVGWELWRIHPNENVYFNQLIGGLPGAAKNEIPSWGNSYGNVYLQGVRWINENAEEGSKLGLPINNMVNVPRIKLRQDIFFSNANVSGQERAGEYVMELSHEWQPKKWYAFSYYDAYLRPVHEVKVDGVSLLKIWKNDSDHVKVPIKQVREYSPRKIAEKNGTLTLDMGETVTLSKIKIKHGLLNCEKQKGGYIRLSTDGVNWIQEPETIDYPQIPEIWLGSSEDTFVFLFLDKNVRYIFIDTQMASSCVLNKPVITVYGAR